MVAGFCAAAVISSMLRAAALALVSLVVAAATFSSFSLVARWRRDLAA